MQQSQKMESLERIADRAKGMLWGMFIGDSLGVFYEFNPINYRKISQETASRLIHRGEGGSRKEFNLKPGIWSDDASQGACLLQTLHYMHKNRLEAFPQAYFLDLCTLWFFKGLNSGIGPECSVPSVGVGNTVFPMITSWNAISNMQIKVEFDADAKAYMEKLPNLPDLVKMRLPGMKKAVPRTNFDAQTLFFVATKLNQEKNLSDSLKKFRHDLENASKALKTMKETARGDITSFSYRTIAASEGAKKYGIESTIKRANGNGSIMRIAGCALELAMDSSLSHEEKLLKIMERAYYQSLSTTPGRLSSDASRMLTFLLYQARHSPLEDPAALITWLLGDENIALFMRLANTQVLPTLESEYREKGLVTLEPEIIALCKEKTWTLPIPEVHKEEGIINPQANDKKYYGSFVTDGLALVLNALYNTSSFEMLVATLVEAGGDADSNAAVAGQLGGAIYGFDAIPWRWIEPVHRQLLSPRILGEDKTPFSKARVNDLINDTLEMLMPETKMLYQKQSACIRYAQLSQDSRFVYLKFPADQQKAVEKYITVCNIPPCARETGDLWFPQMESISDNILLRMEKGFYETLVKTDPGLYPALARVEKENQIFTRYPEIQVSKLILPKAVNKKNRDDGQTHETLCFLEMNSYQDARLFSSFYEIQYTGSYSFPAIQRMGKCDDKMIAWPLQLSSGKALIPLTMDKYVQLMKDFPKLQQVLPRASDLPGVLEREYGELVEKIREIFHMIRKLDLWKVHLPLYSPEFISVPTPVRVEATPTAPQKSVLAGAGERRQWPDMTNVSPAPENRFFAQKTLPQTRDKQKLYPAGILWVPNKCARLAKIGKMAALCAFNHKNEAVHFAKQWKTTGANPLPSVISGEEDIWQVVLTEDRLKIFLGLEDERKETAFQICASKLELPELVTWSEISGMATCEFSTAMAARIFADFFNTVNIGRIVMLSREAIETKKPGNVQEEWMAMQLLGFKGKRGPECEIALHSGGHALFICKFPNRESAMSYAVFWNKREKDIQSDCSLQISKQDLENLVRKGTPEQKARAERVLEQILLNEHEEMLDDCLENLKKFNAGK